jgi:hypothetical protein
MGPDEKKLGLTMFFNKWARPQLKRKDGGHSQELGRFQTITVIRIEDSLSI